MRNKITIICENEEMKIFCFAFHAYKQNTICVFIYITKNSPIHLEISLSVVHFERSQQWRESTEKFVFWNEKKTEWANKQQLTPELVASFVLAKEKDIKKNNNNNISMPLCDWYRVRLRQQYVCFILLYWTIFCSSISRPFTYSCLLRATTIWTLFLFCSISYFTRQP